MNNLLVKKCEKSNHKKNPSIWKIIKGTNVKITKEEVKNFSKENLHIKMNTNESIEKHMKLQ